MDLVDCDDISEQAILHELQDRFQKCEIYSSIGPILIAVNPFKLIAQLYSSQLKESFVDTTLHRDDNQIVNRPHVWMVAQAAYLQVLQDRLPQAVVISGESGGER